MTAPERLALEIERLFTTLAARRGAIGEAEAAPLTATQRVALLAVVDSGPLRLGEVADRLRTTDPTATRTVDVLQALGLVDRIPDLTDRRATQVVATAQGEERVAQRRALLVDLVREPLEQLGSRQQQLFVDLLAELNDVLARPDFLPRRKPRPARWLPKERH